MEDIADYRNWEFMELYSREDYISETLNRWRHRYFIQFIHVYQDADGGATILLVRRPIND